MGGQIIADASKLIDLDDGLKKTTSQLDFVFRDYENLIYVTKARIKEVLDIWGKRKEDSNGKLLTAQEALAHAEAVAQESGDSETITYYYQVVIICQVEYNQILSEYSKIEKIYNDFERKATLFKISMESSRENYIDILQKSSQILNQYAELIRKSSAIMLGKSGINDVGAAFAYIDSSKALSEGGTNSTPCIDQNTVESLYELAITNQTWVINADGSKVFDSPKETGEKLDSCQGKDSDFLGTCGLVSCENVLRLAGYPASEDEVVTYASTTSAGFGFRKLCKTNSLPEDNGGTSAKDRKTILEHFGVKSELKDASIASIANAVSQGRGVIISVYARILYGGSSNHRDLHAITVTSVKKDRYGNVLGFYVCDSGTGGIDNSKFYTAFQIENALSGRPMNVTSIIR